MFPLRNLLKSPSESLKYSANYIMNNSEANNSAKNAFELHKIKYEPVLEEIKSLNKDNIDLKENFKRILNYSGGNDNSLQNLEVKTNSIQNCFKNVPTTISESSLPDLIQNNLKAVEKFGFTNSRISENTIKESKIFIELLSKKDPHTVKLIQDAAVVSKMSDGYLTGTKELITNFKCLLKPEDINPLYDLLYLSSINESISCIAAHGDIALALGAKVTIGTCFSLYNSGQFKFFLETTIADFNFTLIRQHAYKYCTSPGFYISVGFIMIAYSGQNLEWLKQIPVEVITKLPPVHQAFKEVGANAISVLKEDINACNTDMTQTVSSVIQKAGFFCGKVLGSFGSGFFKGTLDNSLETYEKVLKAMDTSKK